MERDAYSRVLAHEASAQTRNELDFGLSNTIRNVMVLEALTSELNAFCIMKDGRAFGDLITDLRSGLLCQLDWI